MDELLNSMRKRVTTSFLPLEDRKMLTVSYCILQQYAQYSYIYIHTVFTKAVLIFQNVPNSWADTPLSHQECNKICQMTTVQAKAVALQLGKPHMTTAQTFPHMSQTISCRTPPCPAPQLGLHAELFNCAALFASLGFGQVSASPQLTARSSCFLLAGCEAETRTSSLSVELTRPKNSLAVGGEILERDHMVRQEWLLNDVNMSLYFGW